MTIILNVWSISCLFNDVYELRWLCSIEWYDDWTKKMWTEPVIVYLKKAYYPRMFGGADEKHEKHHASRSPGQKTNSRPHEYRAKVLTAASRRSVPNPVNSQVLRTYKGSEGLRFNFRSAQ
jgi:hypothetical protein